MTATPYQPTDRPLSDEEKQRILVDAELVRQQTRVQKAQADKLIAEADSVAIQRERNRIALEDARIYHEKNKIFLEQTRDYNRVRQLAEGHTGVFQFNREVSADRNGFFGMQHGTVEPLIAKLSAYSERHPGSDIELVINSPGGSVYAGWRLFGHLRLLAEKGHLITTVVSGMAASMGGVLAQAGDVRLIDAHSSIMIHEASSGVWGTAHLVRDTAEELTRIGERIRDLYVSRSGGKTTRRQFELSWARRDWWLFADEALERGFVDGIRGTVPGQKILKSERKIPRQRKRSAS